MVHFLHMVETLIFFIGMVTGVACTLVYAAVETGGGQHR